MLQQIRDHLTGWVAALIFAPLILAFALWGIQNYHVGGRNYAAKVNGEEISLEEVRQAVRNQLAMYERMSPKGLTPEQEAQIRECRRRLRAARGARAARDQGRLSRE
jgi:hypothetical protein